MIATTKTKSKYRFSDHPWVSYFHQSLLLILAIIITAAMVNGLGIPQDARWSPRVCAIKMARELGVMRMDTEPEAAQYLGHR